MGPMDSLQGLLGGPKERFQLGLLSGGDMGTAIRLALAMKEMEQGQARQQWTGDLAQSLASLPPEHRAKYDTPEAQQSLRASTFAFGDTKGAEQAGLLAPQQSENQPALIQTLLAAGLDPRSPEMQSLIKASLMGSDQGAAPFYQFLPTADGYAAGNARTGAVSLVNGPDGKPLVRAQDDVPLQSLLAGGKAGAVKLAEQDAAFEQEVQVNAPKLMSSVMRFQSLIESIEKGDTNTGIVVGNAYRLLDPQTALLEAESIQSAVESLNGSGLAPVSNKELETIREMFASASKTGEINKTLLSRSLAIARKQLATLQSKDQYFRQNQTLQGWRPQGFDGPATLVPGSGGIKRYNPATGEFE